MSRPTDMTLTQSLTPSQRVARFLSEAKPRWVCQVAKRADVFLRNGLLGNRMGNQAEEALDDLDTVIAELQARCRSRCLKPFDRSVLLRNTQDQGPAGTGRLPGALRCAAQ